jgi:GT2 family glycosyltransferase
MAVLVVYEYDIVQVIAWPTLLGWLKQDGRSGFTLEQVLVYDNSPGPRAAIAAATDGCTYIHDSRNGGTKAAYEQAAAMASAAEIDWLMLLDQDTSLPSGMLDAAASSLANSPDSPGALVPWVFHDKKIVSPARITLLGTVRPLVRKREVSKLTRMSAVASGSLIYVPALRAIQPLPNLLWLDYVDHWIFWRMGKLGWQIVVIDAVIQHSLSVETPAALSRSRMHGILEGEAVFIAELGIMARVIYPVRLLTRIVRYALVSPRTAGYLAKWLLDRAVRSAC